MKIWIIGLCKSIKTLFFFCLKTHSVLTVTEFCLTDPPAPPCWCVCCWPISTTPDPLHFWHFVICCELRFLTGWWPDDELGSRLGVVPPVCWATICWSCACACGVVDMICTGCAICPVRNYNNYKKHLSMVVSLNWYLSNPLPSGATNICCCPACSACMHDSQRTCLGPLRFDCWWIALPQLMHLLDLELSCCCCCCCACCCCCCCMTDCCTGSSESEATICIWPIWPLPVRMFCVCTIPCALTTDIESFDCCELCCCGSEPSVCMRLCALSSARCWNISEQTSHLKLMFDIVFCSGEIVCCKCQYCKNYYEYLNDRVLLSVSVLSQLLTAAMGLFWLTICMRPWASTVAIPRAVPWCMPFTNA